MIEGQSPTTDSPIGLVPKESEKHAKSSDEKAEKDSEKTLEKAEKLAEKWEKRQDRLAKLHLDGDKLLLRWLRSSLFLVTTGIAVERGLKYLEESRTGPSLDPYAVLRMVGLALVLIGLGALWVACVQHRQRLRAIRQGAPAPVPTFSLSLYVSVAVAILSVIAFLAAVVSFGSGRPLAG